MTPRRTALALDGTRAVLFAEGWRFSCFAPGGTRTMNDEASGPDRGAPASGPEPPLGAAPPRRGVGRLLLAPLAHAWRRPLRVLGVAALLGLIGLAAVLIGVPLYASYHLRAARQAVERGHNRKALQHLHAYRAV